MLCWKILRFIRIDIGNVVFERGLLVMKDLVINKVIMDIIDILCYC